MKNMIFISAVAFAFAAHAAGPGGMGGQGGPGGNSGGGMGGSGSFTYDSVIGVTTNANCLVRDGILYGYTPSLTTSVALGSGVTEIADGVFACNTAITSVNLANTSISELPANAFSGCTALKTVVLPSCCTSVGANAFAGCSALSSVTADGVTEFGAYAFAGTALTEVDLDGKTLREGCFMNCPDLVSVANLPSELPDAAFAGCSALETGDYSKVSSFGQAALCGIAAKALTLSSGATLGSYAFAADVATVATQFTFTDGAWPEYDSTAFLGRGYSLDGENAAVFEAVELVDWLVAEADAVTQPENYATASLEAWLSDSSNADAIFAFCYGDDAVGTDALTVEGTTFTFTDTTRSAVAVTPVASYDLSDGAAGFSADNVTLVAVEGESGVYNCTLSDADASAAFMRLEFAKNW